jgi:hypothetical protein
VTHPHRLHATAAGWSLHRSREQLTQAAADEAAQIAAEIRTARLEPAGGLRSTVYGSRHASGGHSDPVSRLLLLGVRPPRINRPALLASRTTETLVWLARTLDVPGLTTGLDPLALLMSAVPLLPPARSATLTRWLADLDDRIRTALALTADRQLIPGVDCPACQVRRLYVQTAAPVDVQTVICSAGCLCTGTDCPCGMPVRAVGVAHIWPRNAVVGAVAGATPTQAA